ncbi:AAA family ATPase [Enterococcus faecium]|uniref:AAA family ATPase n=1 Tax=Enterococcus faecium TaxID=1352 RepID=UPI000DE94209|nr:AAA family ATPase [Enterococcus faecium]RCF82495.1 DNA-binding protein [Enterococcus faecium]RCF88379.1 DNA-binding protein [Enterococcus faecium]RCF91039.1 DNA-binding protein [Enterococcus faecium]RCG02536.1 DNA-binding protein [Enterococcus faecium]RCT69923.1 DNA-binding protein [Enterococcus faecium]
MQIKKATDIEQTKGTYLIYGAPGKGKTLTAKYFPGKTLILDIDRTSKVLRGEKNVDIVYIDNEDTWNDWGNTLADLTTNYVGVYDNVVVDNVSELERCILSSLGAEGKNNGVPSQGDYQYMQFRMVNSLRYMKNLDSNLIWTAWEEIDLWTDSDGSSYNIALPQINRKIRNNILGLCDVVGRLMVKEDDERGFILQATDSTYAKNQLDNRSGCKQSELILDGIVRLPE